MVEQRWYYVHCAPLPPGHATPDRPETEQQAIERWLSCS